MEYELPQVRAAKLRDLTARARLMDEGIDLTQTLPEGLDRPLVPYRVGHGTIARWKQHQRDGESPCVACSGAFSAYEYPMGKPGDWDGGWEDPPTSTAGGI